MIVESIQASIGFAIERERRTGELTDYLEELLRATRTERDPRVAQALMDFIAQYVRASPDLLERVLREARNKRVLSRIRPILDAARSYWDDRKDWIDSPPDLLTMTQVAYLSTVFIDRVSTTCGDLTGTPLLTCDLRRPNTLIRNLLGGDASCTLDRTVDATVRLPSVLRSIHSLTDWEGTLDVTPVGLLSDVPNEGITLTKDSLVPPIIPIATTIPTEPKQPAKGGHVFRVWYATNRVPIQGGGKITGFGNDPDPHDEVHYGRCYAFVPKSHRPGGMGTPFYRRWSKGRFKADHIKLTRQESVSGADDYFADLRREFKAFPDARQLLVYIHGYNVSFEGAALRAAQIGFDLECETAFFSWPSCAQPEKYPADKDRIEDSEEEIAEFLTRVVKESGAEAVHLIAHSMGNRGLARVAHDVLVKAGVRFANIILAAPDVQRKLFMKLAASYPNIADRTTLYVSPRDLALKASKWLQGAPRAGLVPPVTIVKGIDTVRVTQFNLLDLGHGYWATAREVINDMYQLMRYKVPPPRAFLQPSQTQAGRRYWVLH